MGTDIFGRADNGRRETHRFENVFDFNDDGSPDAVGIEQKDGVLTARLIFQAQKSVLTFYEQYVALMEQPTPDIKLELDQNGRPVSVTISGHLNDDDIADQVKIVLGSNPVQNLPKVHRTISQDGIPIETQVAVADHAEMKTDPDGQNPVLHVTFPAGG